MSTLSVAGEDRIGRYKVIRVVGRGQSSMVLEVAEDGTGRRFAIKQLMPEAAEDRDHRRRLEEEARLGIALHHPNLIRVHEFVKDPAQPYVVMELFGGRAAVSPVSAPVQVVGQPKVEPPPKHQLHRIVSQAAAALAYIHEKGWVHRDVNPKNVLVNKAGEVRVIDYGIAKRVPAGLGRMFYRKPTHIEGTPSYLAPEQILKQPPAPSADLYSFGVTCYELACGRKPFFGNSTGELLGKHVRERPSPPGVHCKAITPGFSELVLALLNKRPADRPASFRDVLSRLARVRVYEDDPDPQAERAAY